MTPQEIFGKVFGVTPLDVLGDSDYYYFEQQVEDTKNTFQVSKARVNKFALEYKADELVIACTIGNRDVNGFPETLIVGAALGIDVYQAYHRDTESGQAGNAAVC